MGRWDSVTWSGSWARDGLDLPGRWKPPGSCRVTHGPGQQQGNGGKSASSFTYPSRSLCSVDVKASPSPCPACEKHLPPVPPAGREPSAARRNAPVVASALRPPDKLAICCCLSSVFVMQTRERVAAVGLCTEEVGQFFPLFPPRLCRF